MIDNIDKNIIELLQINGKYSFKEIGKEVGLSISAINERIKKLESQGILKKTVSVIDPLKLGLEVCAFVKVLVSSSQEGLDFIDSVLKVKEIQEFHTISGDYSYLLKIRARNNQELDNILKEKVKSIKGVVRTNSMIVLASHKEEISVHID